MSEPTGDRRRRARAFTEALDEYQLLLMRGWTTDQLAARRSAVLRLYEELNGKV